VESSHAGKWLSFAESVEMAETVVENGVVDGSQADSSLASETVRSENESQQAIEEQVPRQPSMASASPTEFEEVNLEGPSSQPVADEAHAANCDANSSLANAAAHSAQESQQAIEQSAVSHQSKVSTVPTNCSYEASSQHVTFSTHTADSGQ